MNKIEIDQRFAAGELLSEVIHKLEGEAQKKNLILCQIYVNGLKLSEQDEIRLGTTQVADIQNMEIHFEELAHIISDTIYSMKQIVQSLKDNAVDLAMYIKENATGQMEYARYVQYISTIEGLINGLKAIYPHLESKNSNPIFVERWLRAETQLLGTLKEIMGALEAQDYILLADLIEYELDGALTIWQDIINGLE